MSTGKSILKVICQEVNLTNCRKKHWEGRFDENLDSVSEHSEVTRAALQRLCDMILAHGIEEV